MGLISSLIEKDANLKIAQIQADAQSEANQLQAESVQKQIDAQLQANREQLEFNKQEAELAFERNSSKGQLAQLMDAGLSEVQARQIIASGSAGSYSAAPSVNQMQGVDYTAQGQIKANEALNQGNLSSQQEAINAQFMNEMLNSGTLGIISDLFDGTTFKRAYESAWSIAPSILQSSLTASDGGILGNMTTAPLQGSLLRHINEIPPEARGSYAAFCSFAQSAAAPAWCKTADFQQMMQLATESPMAQKSLRSFFDTSNQMLTGDTYFKNLISDSECKSAAAKIASFKVNQEKVNTDVAIIESEYKISILPERYAAMVNSYQAEIAEMASKRDLWNNDDYKKAWLASKITNEEDAAIIAKVMKMKHNGEFKYLNDNPDRAQLFAIYQMFADAGMTDSMFGEVVASLEAYGETALGFGVTDILKDFKDLLITDKATKEQRKTARYKMMDLFLEPSSPLE